MTEIANELKPGDAAPDFTAPRDGGEAFTLSAQAGKSVVLYFYPKDDTSGCTKEAIEFTGLLDEFAAAGVIVAGVSKDSVKKHDKFRDKHELGVVLISDEDTTICEDYGVWKEKSMYGKKYMGIERTTFLIGPDGKIVEVWNKVKAAGHAAKVLERVKEMNPA